MSETLTPKEKAFIELIASGMNQTDACLQVYNCGSKHSASVLATNKLKNPRVSSELARRRGELEAKTTQLVVDNNARFYQMVENYCGGKSIIAQKLSEAVLSDDKRSRLQAIDMFLKLSSQYPEKQNNLVGLFQNIGGGSSEDSGFKAVIEETSIEDLTIGQLEEKKRAIDTELSKRSVKEDLTI